MLAAEVPTSVKLGEPQKLAPLVARETSPFSEGRSRRISLSPAQGPAK